MQQSSCARAIRIFFKTTTLHGFKYLTSRNYCDRVGWLICCCASACCAGVLCAVLWARFLQVPALLTLKDLRSPYSVIRMPLVAVCPPPEAIATYIQNYVIINSTTTDRLKTILGHVLRRKVVPPEHLATLEEIFFKNNMSLAEVLLGVMPPCYSIVRNCQWQFNTVSCGELFTKTLTEWGPCCVSESDKLRKVNNLDSQLHVKPNLNIAVKCNEHAALIGCNFFTKYDGEEWIEPINLTPGYNYLAQMAFSSVVDSDPEKLVDGTCVSADGYSRSLCLLKCKERICGCSDPLRPRDMNEVNILPPCLITQLNCLRNFNFGNGSCKCLPSCQKISTYMALESSYMNAFNDTIDNIYDGLDIKTSSVLYISIRISGSRMFVVNPTETWITLLSSLGGVFNMFLGVGLFSALEILFLVFVKLPKAIRNSPEMQNVSAPMYK